MLELTDINFNSEVINSSLPVVVEFKTEWCPNCKRLAPVLEDLEKEFSGKIKFGKLDVMSSRNVAVEYNILSVPATLIFKEGKLKDKLHGFMPKDKLREVFSSYGEPAK